MYQQITRIIFALLLRWRGLVLTILVPLLIVQGHGASAAAMEFPNLSPPELASYERAASYSRAHRGLALVIMKNGQIIFEDYAGNHTAADARNIYSGTKSFSCAIAVAAREDKLLSLDEPVAQTITEWQSDPQKSKITLRQLLSLTSGIDAGKPKTPGTTPTYAESIDAPTLHAPALKFQYGAVPFQIFGEVMRRKLASTGENPREYLTRRVLAPIGLRIASWRTTADGLPKMSAGAFLSAREWAKYGQLILNDGQWNNKRVLDAQRLAECFQGTTANPGYGLTFWLPMNKGSNDKGGGTDRAAAKLRTTLAHGPLIKAAGVGGQKLYILPAQNLVIVRLAARLPLWGRGFEDAEFLAILFEHNNR